MAQALAGLEPAVDVRVAYADVLERLSYQVIAMHFSIPPKNKKIPISFGNQDFTAFCFSSKWCHQESNRGHKDFQSFALPTELWHLIAYYLFLR